MLMCSVILAFDRPLGVSSLLNASSVQWGSCQSCLDTDSWFPICTWWFYQSWHEWLTLSVYPFVCCINSDTDVSFLWPRKWQQAHWPTCIVGNGSLHQALATVLFCDDAVMSLLSCQRGAAVIAVLESTSIWRRVSSDVGLLGLLVQRSTSLRLQRWHDNDVITMQIPCKCNGESTIGYCWRAWREYSSYLMY